MGTKDCRNRIYQFQKLLLDKKEELLPLYIAYSEKKKYSYTIGIEKSYEYCVLEYPFAFWQWQRESCVAD